MLLFALTLGNMPQAVKTFTLYDSNSKKGKGENCTKSLMKRIIVLADWSVNHLKIRKYTLTYLHKFHQTSTCWFCYIKLIDIKILFQLLTFICVIFFNLREFPCAVQLYVQCWLFKLDISLSSELAFLGFIAYFDIPRFSFTLLFSYLVWKKI